MLKILTHNYSFISIYFNQIMFLNKKMRKKFMKLNNFNKFLKAYKIK